MFTNECFSDRVSTWAEGEEVSQMQTATDRGGGGCQKLLKDCRHPLWMTPYFELLSSNTCISHPN